MIPIPLQWDNLGALVRTRRPIFLILDGFTNREVKFPRPFSDKFKPLNFVRKRSDSNTIAFKKSDFLTIQYGHRETTAEGGWVKFGGWVPPFPDVHNALPSESADSCLRDLIFSISFFRKHHPNILRDDYVKLTVITDQNVKYENLIFFARKHWTQPI